MLFLHGSFNRMSPVCNMTAIRCTVPNCSCDCFTPNKSHVRTCATCKHGWVAHALDKLGFRHLYNCNQVEIVQPSIVFDIASLMLYGCQATPIRLKILLDRLFSVLQHEEVLQVLNGFGWAYEDYARGYILQDTQGTVLDKWTLATRDEEPLILQQFLRFGETKAITQQILLQDNNERPEHVERAGRSDSDIKRFIERTNRIVHPFYRHSDGFLHHHSKQQHPPPPPSQQPPPPPPPPPPQQSLPQSLHQQHHSQAPVHHHHHHHPPPPPPPPPSQQQQTTHQSSSSANHPASNKTLNRHHSTGSNSGHNHSPTGSSQSFGSPVNCTSPMSISPLNRLQNMQPYDYRRENRAGSPDIVRPPTEPQPSAFHLQSNKPPTPTPMSNSLHTGNSGAVSLNLASISCSSPTPPLHTSASLPTLGSSLAHSSTSSQIGNSDLSGSEGGSDDEDTMTSALNLSRSATHDSIYATKKVKHLRKSANPMKRRWNPTALGTLVSNTASGKKRVQCSVCLKTFCDKGALKIHFSAVHLREMHKCTVAGCNMMFSSRRSRNRHSANPNPKLHSPHLRRKISPHDGRTANANPGHYFLGHSLVPPPLGPLQLDTHLSPHHHSHHHHHHQMLPLPGGLALPPPSLSHSNNEFRHHHHRDIKREDIMSNSRTPSPSRECPSVDNLISVPSRSPSPIPINDFKEANENHHHHHHHHHPKNKAESENKKSQSNNNNNDEEEEREDEAENRLEMDVDDRKQNADEPQTAPVELRKKREKTPENEQLNNRHESAVGENVEKNKSPDVVTTTTAASANSANNAPREADHEQQPRIGHQIKKGVRKRKSLNPTRCAISEVEDAIQFVSSEDSSSNDTFLQNDSIDHNGTEKSDEFKDDDKTDDDDDDDLLDDDDKEMDFDDDDDDDADDDLSIKLNTCQSLIPLNKIKKESRGSFSSSIRAAREKLFRLEEVTREEMGLKKFKKSASEGDEAEENSEMALRHLESLSQGHFGDPSQFSLRSGGGHIPPSLHLPLGSSATSNAHGLHPGTSDVYSDASPRLQDSTISGNAHGGGGGSGGSNPDSPLSETQSFSFRDTGLMNCFDVPVDKDNPRRCPTCGKIFQNHFGVKTHYQNVHLKLMHKCTVEGCNAAFPSKRSRDRHSANLNLHRKLLSTTEKNFLDKSLAFASLAANQTLRDEFLSRIYGETPGVLPLAINELYQSKLSASMSESLIHHHHHHNNNNDRAVPNSNHFGSHHPLSLHSAGLLLPSAAAMAAANETSAHLDLGFHLKNAQSRPSPSSLHHSPLNASPPSPPSVHSSGGGSGAFNSMTHNFVYSLEDDLPSPDSNGNFPCKFCHKRFQDGVLLKDHYEKIHLPEMFRCTVNGCNKIFSSQKKRNQHSQNSGVHKHLSTSPTSPDS